MTNYLKFLFSQALQTFKSPSDRWRLPLLELGSLLSYISVLRIRDAYPGSRILIFTHPGSRISDPESRIPKQQQERGVNKNFCLSFSVATNFTKLKINLVLKC